MNRKLRTLLAIAAVGGICFSANAQKRYYDEVFTEAEIVKAQENQVYGINVDFLKNQQLYSNAYISANLAQITAEHNEIRDSILSALAAGTAPNIPQKYFNPYSLDTTSIIKLITPLADNPPAVPNPFQQGMMDVYMPIPASQGGSDTETARPVIIYVHTGNFLPKGLNGGVSGTKDDKVAVEFCQQWAKRGYVAVAPNYRLGWNPLGASQSDRTRTLLNGVFRAITDVKQVVRSLKANATELGIDPDKIILYGQGSGGYVTLAYNFLDKYSETTLPKFDPDLTGITVIEQDYVGDVDGLGGLLNFYQYQSVPGLDADIAFCVNAGGALGDKSWIEGGEAPNLSIHAVRDPFAPFTTGTVIVPTTNEPVVDADGPNEFMPIVNGFGNNDAFKDIPFVDPVTARARSTYGTTVSSDIPVIIGGSPVTIATEGEGMFPLVLEAGNGAPWEWWSEAEFQAYHGYLTQLGFGPPTLAPAQDILDGASAGNPNDESIALNYVDSIQQYIHPRIMVALEIGEWESLNVNEIKGSNDEVVVYPNPAVDQLIFKTSSSAAMMESIEIMDMAGRTVYNQQGLNENMIQLSVDGFNNGLYISKMTLNSGTQIVKQFTIN